MSIAKELLILLEVRTKDLEIGDKTISSTLVAGGSGFKIYSPKGIDGWVLSIGRKNILIGEKDPDYGIVSKYVNLKYQPVDKHQEIKDKFDSLIKSK